MTYTFKVEKREGKIKDEELCMGVVSGRKTESTSLQFNLKDFKKLYAEAGNNSIITLEGLGEPLEVTVLNVTQAPFTNEVHHVDFYALERGVEMNAEVPLVLEGEAPAANLDGIINQILHTVSISCRPRDLIQEIKVDISVLKEIGDSIHVKDLKIPKNITVTTDMDAPVVSAQAPKPDRSAEPAEKADAADVPVVGDEAETGAEAAPEGEETKE